MSDGIQEYLFRQEKNCSTAVRDTLRLIPKNPNQSLKDPLVLSITHCLTSFCDWIRKCRNISLSSLPIRYFRLLYSLGSSLFFLRLIFEMSSSHPAITIHSLPIAVHKGLVKCLSIVGFNCSDYCCMATNPETEDSQLVHLLGEKFNILFPDIIQSNHLNQNLVISFFHCCYDPICPLLVEDLFGDIDDTEDITPSRGSILRDIESHSKIAQEDLRVHITPSAGPKFSNEGSSLHLNVLTKKNEPNMLLSKSRISPMNGHRLALERRLQKQPVARNHHQPPILGGVGTSRKRTFNQEDRGTNTKGTRSRRLIVEDTPVRNSSR
jgi:hypothetical protein